MFSLRSSSSSRYSLRICFIPSCADCGFSAIFAASKNFRLAWALFENSNNAHYPREKIIRGKRCKYRLLQRFA
jgi:hypothetical protein